MTRDVLVKVDGVSKKFCRSLQRSLWYGVCDVAREVLPFTARANGPRRPSAASPAHPTGDGLRPDEFWAVRDVSFELRRGECLGLIGENGAGKTTLLRMFNGLIKPDEGRIEMRGEVGALIALSAGFNPLLTGRENIYISAALRGMTKRQTDATIDEIVDFAEIGEFIDTPVQTYSSGMQVRLGFAVASALKPDVLMLDEVLAVGDLRFTLKCLNRMSEMLPGAAVIFVSHNLELVSRVSTQVLVLSQGRVACHADEPSEGLDFYRGFSSGSREQKVLIENGARLRSIRLGRDEAVLSNSMPTVEHGGPLVAEIHVTLLQSVKHLGVRVLIHGTDPREVADVPSLLQRESDDLAAGDHTFRVSIPSLDLNAGVYWLTVCLTDAQDHRALLRVDNIASFQMQHCMTSWAPVIIRGRWEHTNGAGVTQ
jgi:lipopolysaccharide transport system ATP-binding protein